MGAAKVIFSEVDLSTRVASFQGVYAAIVLKSKKGPVNDPYFISSDSALLKRFTPKQTVEVGMDIGHFSALAYLERGNRLWVIRAANGASYSGLYLVSSSSSDPNAGIPVSPVINDPAAYAFSGDQIVFLYAIDAGAFGQQIAVKVSSTTEADNAFKISVYLQGNETTPLETHLVSRVAGQKDGYGRNIYIDDVLKGSNYIRSINNSSVAGTTLPKTQATALYLAQGSDGSAVSDSHLITALDKLKKREQYPVTVVMDAGNSTAAFQQAIDTLCKTRQDCVGILSTPYSAEVASDYMNQLTTYRNTTLNLNSSYSALYTPHLQITDKFNDRNIWIAPDGHVAGSICLSATQYEIWYPPAGYKRGVLNVLDTAVKFEDGELDLLQDNQINPIKFSYGKGIVIWGQRTLTKKPSALDRLNVRLLLIVVEPAVRDFLEDYLFDLIDLNDLVIIKQKIDDYMELIKSKKGVYDFLTVADSSNNLPADIDNNRVNIDLLLKPSKSAEEINVRVAVVPQSLSFDQARQLLG